MQIKSYFKNTPLSLKSINNESYKFNTKLKSAILSCYNTISSFIKPFFHKTSNNSEFKVQISNIENMKKNENIQLDNNKVINTPHPMKDDNAKFGDLSEVHKKFKVDEIMNLIINDIISVLEEKPTLEKKEVLQFKKNLKLHSKSILSSTKDSSLTEIKNNFLASIIDSILKSDDKIKYEFGNINAYEYFLLNSINETVSRLLANDKNLVKNGEK
ncbi:hypothetical protein ACLHVA_000498 [Proteus mirabilis]|uniref:hypothetical protein n=1 Tax=Proteus mirabilis TaxID=584 RepID=UPI000D527454|nr:hypothetical protein [Proteus mirabilis]AWF40085.1 hypothetical protein CSC16_2633 [Proteus mirabilis]HBC7456218.1 hypothetical protein [Proteus mirabilis]HCT7979774.1 hypothetical protein [Proteus mirabilis]HDU8703012.1 hypothetical protein [Proteus mirabilis]HEJ9445255.1 hypothetical protein [Proteus mirabilis]